MKKRLLIASAALITLSTSAWAIFGIGDVVYDPAVELSVVTQTVHVIEEVQTLIQAVRVAETTYEQIRLNAQYLTNKNAWAYLMTVPSYASTPSLYGSTGGWINAINTGVSVANAYEMATLRVLTPGAIIGTLSIAGQANWAAHYGSIELSDSLTQNLMNVTGSVRGNLMAQQTALAKLQNSTLSDDPTINTETSILNQISGATVIHAQTAQDQVQLLSVMADQATIATKIKRDLMVDEINNATAAQSAAASNSQLVWGGFRDAMTFRIP